MGVETRIEMDGKAVRAISKCHYSRPDFAEVGSVKGVTKGHSSPVGDSPVGQGLGYYDSSKVTDENAEVDLQGH
jgi:hypothetical protein